MVVNKTVITKYYDFAKLFSYNATFNAVCGGRGMGKTWGSKKKVIGDALKTVKFHTQVTEIKTKTGKDTFRTAEVHSIENVGDQFIYLRRYKEELALGKATFFADIEHLWPDWDFKLQGWEAQASPRKFDGVKNRPWATIGYFVSLSVNQNYKSVQFPNVKTIIFDEFIIEKGGQYLASEPTKLVNFYNTVSRYRSNVRVLMLANAVRVENPYFIQYKVEPQKADENNFIFMVKKPNGSFYMLWHFPSSKAFEDEVNATEFGRFIRETDPEYADYAVNNVFADNHSSMVALKPATAVYIYTLETLSGTFSVWYDPNSNMYYCQNKRPNGDEDFVTLVEEWMSEGKRLANFTDKTMGMLRSAYRHDRMRFDNAPTRNAFMQVMKRT
jgi:hypothetical protein